MQGRTDASGMVRLLSDPTTRSGEISFCVTGVYHNRYVYDESANARTCGKVVH